MSPLWRRTIRRALTCLLAIAVLAPACTESPSEPDRPVDVSIVLAPGQTLSVAGTSLSVRFVGVTGDSRCPADAVCILGGDAIVVLDVAAGASTARVELHTGISRPATHGRFTLSLVELAPYPFSARPIAPDEYRATIRIVG